MKILQVIQRKQLRGAEIFACQLGRILKARGLTVHYVYLFDGSQGLDRQFPEHEFISLGAAESKRFWDVAAYARLNKIIRKERYDLVQANAGDTLKYTVFSKTLFKWRSPLVYRNANLMSGFIKGYIQKKLNQFLLSQCSWFVSVSENCRLDLIKLYRHAKDRSDTITIGTYRFEEVMPIDRRIKHDEPIFINIGSLVPEKNQTFLIDVFAAYYSRNAKGFLWIVGDGKMRGELEQLIARHDIAHRVNLWGYCDDVIPLLKASDLMVMPSKVEGLPGVILEALSCEIPVIASNAGGIGEVITNRQNGFCLDTEDIGSYVSCMEEIVTDQNLRNTFKRNGIEVIEKSFLMPQIGNRFKQLYEKVISGT